MIMLINFLSIVLKFANLNPDTDAFACDYYLVDDNEKIIKSKLFEKTNSFRILFKTSHLIDNGLYDENF